MHSNRLWHCFTYCHTHIESICASLFKVSSIHQNHMKYAACLFYWLAFHRHQSQSFNKLNVFHITLQVLSLFRSHFRTHMEFMYIWGILCQIGQIKTQISYIIICYYPLIKKIQIRVYVFCSILTFQL